MDTLHQIALHWQIAKKALAPDPILRDGLHVIVGLGLFAVFRHLLRRTRFPSGYALAAIALIQIVNEVFDTQLKISWLNPIEALSDTALTLGPAILAALILAVLRRRKPVPGL